MEHPLREAWSNALRSWRIWLALAIVVAAYFLLAPVELAFYHLLIHTFALRRSPPDTLGKATYGALMLARLVLNTCLWRAICIALDRSATAFPIREKRACLIALTGLETGLTVMFGTIVMIWGLHSASVSTTKQTLIAVLANGFGWLLLDFVGALGEELYGRAVVLIVAERFVGRNGAVLISGVMFSGIHLSNPGSTRIWLFRLFFQGALLAYATFRTRSLWWSVGYHTGWNWVSAPLFGAVGSGYMDEGHIFNFNPHGPMLVTGGSAGPEGSIFAFFAVLIAFVILRGTTADRTERTHCLEIT
jgi:membrane protease YdiL (CAAX protease family)